VRLWHLTRLDSAGCDEAQAFVIRAATRQRARKLASLQAGDEGPEVWLDPKKVKCVGLKPNRTEGVVIRDFQNG